jgi:FKBP-type peptidyl-prolyl cis-trans isomerase
MKPTFLIAGALVVLASMSAIVPEAQALRGRGAAFVVGAAAGSASASSAQANAAASQQQAAAAQQQTAAAQQQAAAAEQQAAAEKQKAEAAQKEAAAAKQQAAAAQQPAAAPGKALPMGTVVASLPAGCTPTPVGEVNYYYCGGNFYQAVYEGSTLKYITTKPK